MVGLSERIGLRLAVQRQCKVHRQPALKWWLPVEVKPHCQEIGLRRPERCLRIRDGMNPVEHDSRAIGPVPVQADGQIVIPPRTDVVEVEIRPASLRFPRSPAAAIGGEKEIRARNVAAELSPVLSEPFVNAIFTCQPEFGLSDERHGWCEEL